MEYTRKIMLIGVPVNFAPGTFEQNVMVLGALIFSWLLLAYLKPYMYRGDAYFAHASYALTVAGPLMKLGGMQPNSAADGILTALLIVALILFVLPDQLIERFEARFCARPAAETAGASATNLSQLAEFPAPGGKKASSPGEAKV